MAVLSAKTSLILENPLVTTEKRIRYAVKIQRAGFRAMMSVDKFAPPPQGFGIVSRLFCNAPPIVKVREFQAVSLLLKCPNSCAKITSISETERAEMDGIPIVNVLLVRPISKLNNPPLK